jgi:hypothetical protein
MVFAASIAVFARYMGWSRLQRCFTYGMAGSVLGYVAAPMIGFAVGTVPDVMIQPHSFFNDFNGCIAPWALFTAAATSDFGILCGFVLGALVTFRRIRRYAA